ASIDITGQAAATVRGRSARIDCSFFQKPDASQPLVVRQDIQEWVWPYGREQNPQVVKIHELLGETISSVRRPRLLAVQRAGSCMLLSVLSPRRAGQADRIIKPIPVQNGLGLEIQGDGVADTLLIAPDHKLILA